MKDIVRRVGARRDLVVIFRHYAREAGIGVADRFLIAAETTFQRISDMPNLGARYRHHHPALAELRVCTVGSRFKVYLVFYRPIPGGIEVIRVLHGARDVAGILAAEFGIGGETADDDGEAE